MKQAVRLVGLVVLSIAVLTSRWAAAGFPIADHPRDDTAPAATYNPSTDEYLVVWELAFTATDHDLYARRVTAGGSTPTGWLSVAATSQAETHASVAHNASAGEYLVVYEVEATASDHQIYGQRLDSSGAKVGTAFSIASLPNYESRPRVAYNPWAGEYLVVWEHRQGSGEFIQNDVRGQRLTASGALAGPAFVIAGGALDESFPALAFGTGVGDYLVVWQERRSAPNERDIRGQLVGGTGVPVGGAIEISTWEHDQWLPAVAYDPTADRFLVVWEDHHWANGLARDIYGQLLAGDGSRLGANFAISWDGANAREAPTVAFLPALGQYQVAWEYEFGSTDHDVHRRRVGSDGALLGSEVTVTAGGAHERTPALAADGAWSALVAWADERDLPTNGSDVYGEVVAPRVLSGHVYQGLVGDRTAPLAGVAVELYCADAVDLPGDLETATATEPDGSFRLPTWGPCVFTNLIEADRAGFSSVGAASVGGTVVDPHWIQYPSFLGGLTLSGNEFWDILDPPPGGWSGFGPADWVEELSVTCSVQVADEGSGLDVSTAEYAYSVDGAGTWSPWLAAGCSGSDGTTQPQTLTAASVPFGQDSGPTALNRVRFRVRDMAGNLASSPHYLVPIDSSAPVFAVEPFVTGVTADTADVSWETDEPCTGAVDYGTQAGSYPFRAIAENPSASHSLRLAGLAPATTYRVRVAAEDPAGKTVTGRDLFFRTLAAPDATDPSLVLQEPPAYQGVVTVTADAGDDDQVDRVEFYLDGARVFTGYGTDRTLVLDTTQLANGAHTLRGVVFDRAGNSREDLRTIDVSNLVHVSDPTVTIASPAPDGATVAGTVQVVADLADDVGLGQAFFRVDGQYQGFRPISGSPTATQVTFDWDTTQVLPGAHLLEVEVYDTDTPYARSGAASREVNVNQGAAIQPPKLQVSHSVTRYGNVFAVGVIVDNVGGRAARDVRIQDFLKEFQPIASVETSPVAAEFKALYDPYRKEWECEISLADEIPPTGSRTLTYHAIPVLPEAGPATPLIGFQTGVHYDADDQGLRIHEWFDVPVPRIWGGQETIAEAYDLAVGQSDYLLVTHPVRLLGYGSTHLEGAYGVLSDMAELARYRNGVLGFLKSYDPAVLKNLIKARIVYPGGVQTGLSTGDWSRRLQAGWVNDGYLLLVGESNVVPAWSRKVATHIGGDGKTYTWIADPADYPYASTWGDEDYPELSVGRMVGNTPAELRTPLRTGIGLARGDAGYLFDRSDTMLVSGFPGTSMVLNTVAEVAKAERAIGNRPDLPAGATRTWHTPDHAVYDGTGALDRDKTHDAIHQQFLSEAPGADVIFLAGHGSWATWDALSASEFGQEVDPFGGANPFVFASSCETGKHSAGFSFAESVLSQAAAGYLGAVTYGACSDTGLCPNSDRFFGQWGASVPAGLALKRTKQNLGFTKIDRIWGSVYHLFGDPKFGLVSAPAAAAAESAAAPLLSLGTVDVVVPDYAVVEDVGHLRAEIPGGDQLWETGMPIVPIYQVRYDLAPEVQVQDVLLLSRSVPVTAGGFVLPVAALAAPRNDDPAFEAPPGVVPDWWPQKQFDWQVVESGAGTTLVLTLYPFYYNHLTTEIAFHTDYTFDVQTLVSATEIKSLSVDQTAYLPGDLVSVALDLENAGATQDVVVEVEVEREPGWEVAAGLQLETLADFQGSASWAGAWDTTGVGDGYYRIRATLRDPSGQLLDQRVETLRVGLAAATLSGFLAAPGHFSVGDVVALSVTLDNTGSTDLSGAVVFRVLGPTGAIAAELRQEFADLLPGAVQVFADAWDTTGSPEGTYQVLAFAEYDGVATEPTAAVVSTFPPCLGDTDGDGDVDGSDVATAAAEFGGACVGGCAADTDGDGTVGVNDLQTIAGELGRVDCP